MINLRRNSKPHCGQCPLTQEKYKHHCFGSLRDLETSDHANFSSVAYPQYGSEYRMRMISFSSSVRNQAFVGVLGKRKSINGTTRIVIAPSTTNNHLHP